MNKPHITYSERDQICIYIQNKQWGDIVPFVDRLTKRIDDNIAILGDVLNLLKATTEYNHSLLPDRSAVHKIMDPITILVKELAVNIVLGKMTDASDIAGRIRNILLMSQKALDATVVDDTPKIVIADSIGTLGKKPTHNVTRSSMK